MTETGSTAADIATANDRTMPAFTALDVEGAPLRKKIIAALRRAIETGELKPGDRLVEKDLCAALNVSRTSLREALRELEAHRVVSFGSMRQLIVTPIKHEDALNLYGARAVLEALIVEQFIERADAHDVAALKAAAERLKGAYTTNDIAIIYDVKRAFYDDLCCGAENAVVNDLLSMLHLRTSTLRGAAQSMEERWGNSIAEINELMGCIDRRDGPAAAAVVRKHIANACRAVTGTSRLSIGRSD